MPNKKTNDVNTKKRKKVNPAEGEKDIYTNPSITGWDIPQWAMNFLWNTSFRNTAKKQVFDKDVQMAWAERFKGSMDLGKIELPPINGIENYKNAQLKAIDDCFKVKGPDETQISTKLNADTDEAKVVKKQLEGAFKVGDDIEKAKRKFEKKIGDLQRLVDDPKNVVNPFALVTRVHQIKNQAHGFIADQQKKEITALETKFAEPEFAEKFKNTLGITDTAALETVKTNMLNNLKESHKKQLDAFDESVDKPLRDIHKRANIEVQRISFLATMRANSKLMREKIEELHQENLKKSGEAADLQIVQNENDKRYQAMLKNMKIEDLPVLFSLTQSLPNFITKSSILGKVSSLFGGKQRKFDIKKEANGTVTFTADFPNTWRLLSPIYYASGRDNRKADIKTIAEAIWASGCDTITMTASHRDKNKAMDMAREAYEAALEAGFDPENITVKVPGHGKDGAELKFDSKNVKELFASCPSRLAAAEKLAAQNKEVMKNTIDKLSNDEAVADLKKQNKDYKGKDMLEKLAGNYDKFIASTSPHPTDWATHLDADYGLPGKEYIDKCLKSADKTAAVMTKIAYGLTDKNGEEATYAKKACSMFQELYKNNDTIKQHINDFLGNDPAKIRELEESTTGDKLESLLRAKIGRAEAPVQPGTDEAAEEPGQGPGAAPTQ